MKKEKKKLTADQAIRAHKKILKNNLKLFPKKSEPKSNLNSKNSTDVEQKEEKKPQPKNKSKSKNSKNDQLNKSKKGTGKITKDKANKIIKSKISSLLTERGYHGYSESSIISIAKAKFLHAKGKLTDDELEQILQAYEP